MRLDVIELDCPKCKKPIKLFDDRIPEHFLDEQIEGVLVKYNGADHGIMALTFRKQCRLSGARIDSLIAPGDGSLLP